jgi:hypothetical protein
VIRTSLRHATVLVTAAVGASVGLVVPLVAASTPAAAACVVDALLVNSCRPWLGAAANGYPNVGGATGGQILAHEQRIGRPLDVVHLYTTPGQMQLSDESRMFATRPGTILSVTWQPASRWADANGNNATTNANIDRMADSIKSLGSARIMLTVHHEPEDDLTGGGVGCASNKSYVGRMGTPPEYRTMWRTVRQRFDARGVTNVVWVLNYMGYSGWDCVVDDLYPGNDLVDWIMWDPYGTEVDWPALIGRFYDYLTRNSTASHDYLSKVWGIAEWGSWHNATQNHAYLLNRTAKTAVETNRFPRLKAISVFDVSGTCRIAYDRNGNYDATELALYREYANSPAFSDEATPPPGPDTTPPTVPTGFTATPGSARISLAWNASTDNVGVAGYYLTRDGTRIATLPADTRTYVNTGLTAGRLYTYQVRAFDAAGNRSTTTSASARPT